MKRILLGAAAAMLVAIGPAMAGVSSTLAFVDVTPDGSGRWLFTQAGYEEGATASGFFGGWIPTATARSHPSAAKSPASG